jgi:1,2-alpha-glucosylglycerol phosphorylase
MTLKENLHSDSTWDIYETHFEPDQLVTTGSNFMVGNGYLGYRGTFCDDTAKEFVACVVTDTYDNADGVWTELATVPNGLYTALSVDGEPVRLGDTGWDSYRRGINVQTGLWEFRAASSKHGFEITERRTASYDDIHLLSSQLEVRAKRDLTLSIKTGIDGKVWSLNGEHFAWYKPHQEKQSGVLPGPFVVSTKTKERSIAVEIAEDATAFRVDGEGNTEAVQAADVEATDRSIFRSIEVSLKAGETFVVEKYMTVYSSNDLLYPGSMGEMKDRVSSTKEAALLSLTTARERGFDDCLARSSKKWDSWWRDMDIVIDGDEFAQTVVRFNQYHNIIAAPAHAEHLPLGARGLSCQAYQGAAFWDQEMFNMPTFLFTKPELARNILVYRGRTIDGARKKARDLGYRGAFYAWISGDTGEEICPSYFFKDVLTGRKIRNHFNDWQIHVSPDISYAIRRYVAVTGDTEYLLDYGAEVVFEVARFLASRVHFRLDKGQYEIIRVLGPDEYHENVDNNFFTNYQSRFALEYALEVWEWLQDEAPETWPKLRKRLGVEDEEIEQWRDIAAQIYVPKPGSGTKLIEQFQGFWDHEDITPEKLKERLLDPGEYWGWPNGIAVATQVSKQADVTQLFMLHPTAYPVSVMRANWDYYEPRTQHGSSLSPAVYAITAAWTDHADAAVRYFRKATTVDLFSEAKAVSGGTFIGGIHTAACGVVWQIVTTGFAGLYLVDGGFGFAPRIPKEWQKTRFSIKRFGRRVSIEITPQHLSATADESNDGPLVVEIGGNRASVAPGVSIELNRFSSSSAPA